MTTVYLIPVRGSAMDAAAGRVIGALEVPSWRSARPTPPRSPLGFESRTPREITLRKRLPAGRRTVQISISRAGQRVKAISPT